MRNVSIVTGLGMGLAFVLGAGLTGLLLRGPVPEGVALTPAQVADREEMKKALAQAPDTSEVFAKVAKLASPSVVHIAVSRTFVQRDPFEGFFEDDMFRRFFGNRMPQRRFRQEGLGSGFIMDDQGHVLTNNHVVENADEVIVRLADRREIRAKVVGTDPQTDVAVLKVDAPNLIPLPAGDSDAVNVGNWVIAIGNPFGLEQTLTVGVVSAKGRANVGILDYEDFIQTDAAINPGNSGGPLLNVRGEAVGITTAIFSRSGGYQGIGFAIPIKMARAIMDQLVKDGRVRRGVMGVHLADMDEASARELGLSTPHGAYIARVLEKTPAARAGLASGDVVLKVNGAEVRDAAHLRSMLVQTAVGTEIRLRILRSGKERDVTVKLGDAEY